MTLLDTAWASAGQAPSPRLTRTIVMWVPAGSGPGWALVAAAEPNGGPGRFPRGGRRAVTAVAAGKGDGALSGGETHRAKQQNRTAEPGLVDEITKRLGLRGRLRAHPALGPVYRLAVAVIGLAVIALGIVLLPLPGPGWLVVFLGLGILATEFAWAERLLDFVRNKVRAWTRWLARQRLVVKGLVALGSGSLVVGIVAAYLAWRGVPEWVPFG